MIRKNILSILLLLGITLSIHAQQQSLIHLLKTSTLEIPQQRNDYIQGLKKADALIKRDQALGTFLGLSLGSLIGFGISCACNANKNMKIVGTSLGAFSGVCVGVGITFSDSHKEKIYCSFENYCPLNDQFQQLKNYAYECNEDMLDLLIASEDTDTYIKQIQIERSLFNYPLIHAYDALKMLVLFCQKVDSTITLILMHHCTLKNTEKKNLETYLSCAKETIFLLKKTIAEYKEHPAYLKEVNTQLEIEIKKTERRKLESEIQANIAKTKCQKAKAEESFAKTVETWHGLLFGE